MKRLLAALACCGLLSLSACSDDSSSSADPPTTAPTSASSDPTSTPTDEGETPEEFVRRWVEVDRQMQNSGDTDEYRQITKGCTACKGVADQVEAIYEAGGYVKTDGWQIESRSSVGQLDENGEVAARLNVSDQHPPNTWRRPAARFRAFRGDGHVLHDSARAQAIHGSSLTSSGSPHEGIRLSCSPFS